MRLCKSKCLGTDVVGGHTGPQGTTERDTFNFGNMFADLMIFKLLENTVL